MKRSPITRLGSENAIRADVRVIAATNRDLEQLIREGRFREDLYYRLNLFPRFVPPLRERRTDILLLADYYAIDPRRFRSAAAAPSR